MGILSFLVSLVSFVSKIFSFFSNRNLQKEGAQAQANKENQTSVVLQTKIAEAEASTDKSKAALIESVKKGDF